MKADGNICYYVLTFQALHTLRLQVQGYQEKIEMVEKTEERKVQVCKRPLSKPSSSSEMIT